MRFTNLATGLVLVACSACSSAPEPVAAPAPREPRVTYAVQKADVRTALDEIARQGRISIILDSDPRVSRTVSLSMNEVDPKEALMSVAKAFDLRVKEEAPGLYRVSPAP